MALLTLKDIYKQQGKEFIEDLFKSYVIVSEQIDGSRFMFQKHFDDSLIFYKKTGVEIGHIDRTLMSFYEKGIKYVTGLEKEIMDKIPDNWTFGFKYFPSLAPINIVYDRMPKNNLILTDISVRNDTGRVVKVINDTKVLRDWANILGVELPPIIYEGYLTNDQKEKITKFLEVNEQDLITLFKTDSFTKYIITILNTNLKTTALSNSIDKDIEGIIFKFIKPGETEFFSAKMIDPVFNFHQKHLSSNKPRVANDMYQIAILDIVEFIEQYKLNDIMLSGSLQEERYVELISALFNAYVATNGHKYIGVDFEVPDFAKRPEFNININNITNARTKEILNNDYMRNLFKIMLSSFRRHRKNSTDILTNTVIDTINDIVDKIESKVRVESKGNVALDFDTFLKQKKYSEEKSMFEAEIFEGITVDYPDYGLKKVNVVAGRFQPFTIGHIAVFEQLYKQNGYPIIVAIVKGLKPDPERNPFPEDLQLRMFAALQKQYKFLEAAVILPTASIDKIYNRVRPAYEPVLWGAGSDRVKTYEYAINKYKDDLGVLPEFKVFEIKRDSGDTSATKVRESLIIEDRAGFHKLTPKSIHKFFEELKEVMGIHTVVTEKIVILTEGCVSLAEPNPLAILHLNEGYTGYTKEWEKAYNQFTTKVLNEHPVSVAPSRPREVLRADFGDNVSGVAINNIEAFLLKSTRLKINKDYNIEEIMPKQYVDDLKQDLSGQFNGYAITLKNDIKILGKDHLIGDILYITNKYKTGKSGEKSIIMVKQLTPDALGITGKEYHSARPLYSDVQSFINSSAFPERYKEFILKSTELIMNDSGNSNTFSDFESYAGSGKQLIYNTPHNHFDGIDLLSINNIQNDFGEILGAFMLFNILKNTGDGLLYPTASNEALVDFYFDEYKVSSKAGGGATPSGTTAMQLIHNAHIKGDLTFDANETDFYESVVKHWLYAQSIARSGIYSVIIKLASVHLGPSTGYSLISEESGLDGSTMSHTNLIEWLDKRLVQEDGLKFLIEFVNRTGSQIKPKPYLEQYIKRMSSSDTNRVGLVFYPIMIEVEQILNQKYVSVLTTLVQKVSNVKQLYMTTRINKNLFEFKTKQFKTSNFKFERQGSVKMPFNKMLGITITK